MRHWIVETSDGQQCRYMLPDDQRPSDLGISENARIAEAPCMGEPHESWDFEAAAWVDDPARIAILDHNRLASVDDEHCRLHGAEAVQRAHVRKSVEAARYMAADGEGDGAEWRMLAVEASALGIDLRDLAGQVLENDEATIAAEVERRVAKQTIRGRSEP